MRADDDKVAPNCMLTYYPRIDAASGVLPTRAFLVAKQRIPAHVELTWDYGRHYERAWLRADEPVESTWSGWASGETELAAVQKVGRWPDGQAIGCGHGQPYLQPKYARLMRFGQKTVEGRPGTGWASNVKVNDWITFKITASGGKKLICRATRVRRFATFEAMLRECGVEACLPGLAGGLEEGVRVYKSFGTNGGATYAEIEAESGAIAIDVEPLRPAA